MTYRTKRLILSTSVSLAAIAIPVIVFGTDIVDWKLAVMALTINGAYFLGGLAQSFQEDNR